MDKVLIVDDNPVNVKVLSATLSDSGYDLLTANNGERALMVSERAKPDLILLDINMPGINGFETCKRLKANPVTKDIPVIFLSALNEIENKIEGFEVGGVDYISKPFNKQEVCIRIENHLKISKLSRELELKNQDLNEAFEEIKAVQEQLIDINQMLVESIQYSQRLQNASMPSPEEFLSIFPDSFALYLPKSIVSGDFYWALSHPPYRIIAVGDCTGHGVPGAFMSLMGITSLMKIIEDQKLFDPGMILNRLDFEIQRIFKQQGSSPYSIKDGMDIVICVYNEQMQTLHYASAHRPFLRMRNGELTLFEGMRQSIGYDGYHTKNPFVSTEIPLEAGDTFYLYTDGVTDQFGGATGRKFTPKRLRELVTEIAGQPFIVQKETLYMNLKTWRGHLDQTDDITIVAIKFR